MENSINKSLKKLKQEVESFFNENDYPSALNISKTIIKLYPKNKYGYVSYIRALTNDYNKYIYDEELKDLKKVFEQLYEISSKSDKIKFKKDFDDYIYDLKEVENLKKIKKEIITKEFLKELYVNRVTILNQNMNLVKRHNHEGLKIKSVYDLINGLFFVFCLIFNLINRNYLLFLTVPFGIFGIINVYSFLDTNLFSKHWFKKKTNKVLEEKFKDKKEIQNEIEKTNNSIIFLMEQKKSSINKLPESFILEISDLIEENEKSKAKEILSSFSPNNIAFFVSLLEENTNLTLKDVNEIMENDVNKDNSSNNFKKNEIIYMKSIRPINYIALIVTLIISIASILIIIRDFKEYNLISFVVALITGTISMHIYNIDTGKHGKVTDTFSDNLLSTVFNSTVIYNLLYSYYVGDISVAYGFLSMPIVFALIFMGFVMFVSILKYKYLLKKLRS